MPSFQDSAVLILIALLLFGPKGMAQLARQLGKLMAEFRRASSDFRLQMEDEFRASEQLEQQKKIAAIEAAAPVPPVILSEVGESPFPPASPQPPDPFSPEVAPGYSQTPIPIASSGDLNLMPPATGLPVARSSSSTASSASGLFDSIPHIPDPDPAPVRTREATNA